MNGSTRRALLFLGVVVCRGAKGAAGDYAGARKILDESPALRGTVVPAELAGRVKFDGKGGVVVERRK